MSLVDEVITVSEEDAYAMMRFLGEEEGLLVGMSSGANAVAASRVASRMEPGQRVVTILADTGDRYFSLAEHFG
jgi:cysteine synthase A